MTNEIFSDKEVIFRNALKWLAWFSAQCPSAATALRDGDSQCDQGKKGSEEDHLYRLVPAAGRCNRGSHRRARLTQLLGAS
jgi:hypothetical protein